MYRDEVISEVWKIRDEYSAEHHYNLKEIVADIQQQQKLTDTQLVDRRKKIKQETQKVD